MSFPLISVIVPVYNVENYLNECVDSIVNQTYKNLEIILVNDGSTDKSGEICNSFSMKDDRIKVIHKNNGGLSDARNYGLESAKGEYICFVDSDDIVKNNMVESLYSYFNSEDILFVEGGIELIKNENVPPSLLFNNHKNKNIVSIKDAKQYLRGMLIYDIYYTSSCTKLYNHRKIDGLRFRKGINGEDEMFNSELLYRNLDSKVIILPESFYFYRMRIGSISRGDSNKFRIDTYKNRVEESGLLSILFPDEIKRIKKMVNMALLEVNTTIISNQKFNREEYKKYHSLLKKTKYKDYTRDLNLKDRISVFLYVGLVKHLPYLYRFIKLK